MTRSFKVVAFLEGMSLLLLLLFAMPMKYIYDDPIYVKIIGMAHGWLFIGYIILAIVMKKERKWTWMQFAEVCVASIVPFGTFYIERKYLRNETV